MSAPASWLPTTVLALLVGLATPAHAEVDPVGVWPLRPQPEVAERFTAPSSLWGPGHRGVDLAGHAGQAVRSSLRGTVTFVGRIAGRGVVVVSHGDTRTTYEPVSGSVGRGAVVRSGEVIGRLELPGSHCFPRACLHWGWLRGETYLDPLDLVGAGPVRLLPLAGLPVLPAGTQPVVFRRPAGSPYADWQPLLRWMEGWFGG